MNKGGFEINDDSLSAFEKLINYLLDRNVQVEFYLPSHYPIIWNYIEKNQNYYDIIRFEKIIRDFASKKNILVRGTYNPYLAGVKPEDFADNIHLTPYKMLENFNIILN